MNIKVTPGYNDFEALKLYFSFLEIEVFRIFRFHKRWYFFPILPSISQMFRIRPMIIYLKNWGNHDDIPLLVNKAKIIQIFCKIHYFIILVTFAFLTE